MHHSITCIYDNQHQNPRDKPLHTYTTGTSAHVYFQSHFISGMHEPIQKAKFPLAILYAKSIPTYENQHQSLRDKPLHIYTTSTTAHVYFQSHSISEMHEPIQKEKLILAILYAKSIPNREETDGEPSMSWTQQGGLVQASYS